MNALANHGYLPRDGKNIDYEAINEAANSAYNFVPGFYKDIVDLVFKFNISTTSRPTETFDLRDLARHDTIEADGSLTRNDIYFGDDVQFDATVWTPVSKDLGLNQFNFFDRFVTVETAAKATKNRYELAKSVNPEFNASAMQHLTEYGTTALYLLTVWDNDKEAAPKPWVKALLGKPGFAIMFLTAVTHQWFTEEDRIPYREGYKKGSVGKTNERLNNLTGALRDVVGWKP